jgi:hypothetical protein
MNTARTMLGGAGIQTLALAYGGIVPPTSTATESYNGVAWTSVPSLSVARRSYGSSGSQTAALYAGGDAGPASTDSTEEWTGSQLTVRTITTS